VFLKKKKHATTQKKEFWFVVIDFSHMGQNKGAEITEWEKMKTLLSF
jgi:hypothetical protein